MSDRGLRPAGYAVLASTVAAAMTAGAAYVFAPNARAQRTGVRAAAPAERPASACAADVRYPKRQLRGVWIATVRNLDWPSRPALSPKRQRAEYLAILDRAVKYRFNAVFVQVRSASDALYRSSLEPWSRWLTGTAGRDPGWDPLPFLVDEAHRRGLEFHAWFNPYRAADPASARLPASHPARVHPEWTVTHEGRLYYDPGLPEVRDWVTRVVTDVVRRYDVDGVHFDDYFYPYPGKGTRFADAATFKAYGAGMRLADWRRDNVNRLVAQVSAAVRAAKPYVRFGISPFGIWRNKAQDPTGSDTTGMSGYDAIYADAKAWIKARTVDYVMPQLYWPRGFAPARYDVLARWWANAVRGTGVDLYIGQALYRVGNPSPRAWTKVGELPAHLAINREHREIGGDVYFSATSLLTNPLGVLDRLVTEHYSRPALPPVPERLRTRQPPAPRGVRRAGDALVWRPTPNARAYAVYRVAGPADRCATTDTRNLLAIVPASDQPRYAGQGPGTYYVTTIDRTGNESAAALARG